MRIDEKLINLTYYAFVPGAMDLCKSLAEDNCQEGAVKIEKTLRMRNAFFWFSYMTPVTNYIADKSEVWQVKAAATFLGLGALYTGARLIELTASIHKDLHEGKYDYFKSKKVTSCPS